MGNAMFFCMVQPAASVRVIKSDGEVLDLDHPVMAKQLMKVYPGHLVVHCSQVSRNTGIGQRGKVSMIRAEETLAPGQTYCLLRVPTQAGKGLLPKSTDFRELEKGCKKGKTTMSSATLTLRGLFGDSKDGRVCDGDIAQVGQKQQQFVIQYTVPPPASLQGPWRPQLDAIIESPLSSSVPSRANSITMSPLARQAGYFPASQMRGHQDSRRN